MRARPMSVFPSGRSPMVERCARPAVSPAQACAGTPRAGPIGRFRAPFQSAGRGSILLLSVCGWFAGQASAEPDGGTLALVGATVVDVSGFGRSAADLHDSVILVRGATIAAVGPRGAVALPPGAHPVDV